MPYQLFHLGLSPITAPLPSPTRSLRMSLPMYGSTPSPHSAGLRTIIENAKLLANASQLIPFPYITAAANAVIALLDTVDVGDYITEYSS